MSELLNQGKLKPVPTAVKGVTGYRPSPPTCWRWRIGATGGVKLEATFVLGRWMTTEAAVRDFLKRRSEAKLQPRQTAPEATDEELRDAGLL